MHFEFATAQKIIFGNGSVGQIPHIVKVIGSHIFLVVGISSGPNQEFVDSLVNANLQCIKYHIHGEPTVGVIEEATTLARDQKCDLVIGFGGGSAIDTGKAVAAFVTNAGNVTEYLEVIGDGKPLVNMPLPFIAVPTTAGTGAEVTSNAVIGSPKHRVKVSLRSAQMLPCVAVVDPELTLSLPDQITASTGLDALTQLIEAYVSKYSNPISDGFCLEGITRASHSLKTAYHYRSNLKAREDMSLASLLGGMALANAKLGAVHGFAGPIGGMFPAPHGSICAALLPHVFKANAFELMQMPNNNEYIHRFTQIAEILTGIRGASIDDGITWLSDLVEDLNIPPLSVYGITQHDFPEIIEKSIKSSSMKGNPVSLDKKVLNNILRAALN